MLEISKNEVLDSLRAENPWWELGRIDRRYDALPRRAYFDSFFDLLVERTIRRAVVLMGPRRVGKTVMMQQAIMRLITDGVPAASILYVSVDTPTYSGMGLERLLRLFLDANALGRDDACFVLFDEVQYLKDWEAHLKALVDKYPMANFVASGSSAAALARASKESGAGRFTDFHLPPLTFAEYLAFIECEGSLVSIQDDEYISNDIKALNREFINYINYGGYPEAVFSDLARDNPARYVKSDIIEKVLLRDLPSLYGISDVQELNRLFTSIAYNTGNAVSLEKLSQSSGVSKPTISRYLDYLEAAFLIVRVRRVDEKANTFAREREFKVYLTNPSMRAALFRPVTEDSENVGSVVETALFSQWFHSDGFANLHYARWKRGRGKGEGEVDMVYVDPAHLDPLWAVEAKWSDRFHDHPRELDGLIEFARRNGLEHVRATTRTKQGFSRVDGIGITHTPAALYCYLVGKNTVAARTRRTS